MGNPIDLTGTRFGRFTVLNRVKNNKYGGTMWLCKCDCGNERIVSGKCLRNGHTQSCGCYSRDVHREQSFIDHTGEVFGRLTVLSRADDYIAPNGKHHVMWNCQCSCGNTTVVDACGLTSGKTKSCGCLKKECEGLSNLKHGGRNDRLYKVYYNMRNRCLNQNAADYKYYGERGITICDEWLNSYSAFRDWAYKNGYDAKAPKGVCTIDRIDVDGNYEPSNCRWVSMTIQTANRRNVINKRQQSSKKSCLSSSQSLQN